MKNTRLYVRVPVDLKTLWQTMAIAQGETLSEYILHSLDDRTERLLREEKVLLETVAGLRGLTLSEHIRRASVDASERSLAEREVGEEGKSP